MSDRYKSIVAIMDDPVNLACILREFKRRSLSDSPSSLLVPPVPLKGGGWIYPTFEEALRKPRPKIYPSKDGVEVAMLVFEDGTGWFIFDGENEVGPFDTEGLALSQAELLAKENNWVLLEKLPWEDGDEKTWPPRP